MFFFINAFYIKEKSEDNKENRYIKTSFIIYFSTPIFLRNNMEDSSTKKRYFNILKKVPETKKRSSKKSDTTIAIWDLIESEPGK
jgi:hypothetical protein